GRPARTSGRGGRRRRAADRSALRSGSRAQRRGPVALPGTVRTADGGTAHHRASHRSQHLPRTGGTPRMGTVGDPPPFERVFIAGCGLVGGSLGLVVKALWPDVEVRVLDPGAPPSVRQHFTLATSATDAGWADLVV